MEYTISSSLTRRHYEDYQPLVSMISNSFLSLVKKLRKLQAFVYLTPTRIFSISARGTPCLFPISGRRGSCCRRFHSGPTVYMPIPVLQAKGSCLLSS